MNKTQRTFLLIALSLVVWIIYSKTLHYPTFFDDHGLEGLSKSYSPFPLGWEFWKWAPRSFAMWTFNVFYYYTTEISVHRTFNIVLHIFNTLLVYLMIFRMTKDRSVAYLTACLFGLDPAAIFAVSYLVERTILMATTCALLQTMLCYETANTEDTIDSAVCLLLSVIAYFLCLACKEHSAPMVAVFLLMPLLYCRGKRLAVLMIVGLAILALGFKWAYDANGFFLHEGGYYERISQKLMNASVTYKDSFKTQALLFFKYAWMWVNPTALRSVDMREAITQSYFGVVCYGLTFLTGIVLLLRRHLEGLALVLLCSLYAVELQTVRVGEIFVIYRSYLYSICYCILLASLLKRLNLNRSMMYLGGVLILVFSYNTFRDLDTFSSPLNVWQRSAETLTPATKCQGSRIYGNLGAEMIRTGKHEQAYEVLKKGLECGTHFSGAVINMASVCHVLGKKEEAEKYYNIAIQDPDPVARSAAERGLSLLRGTYAN